MSVEVAEDVFLSTVLFTTDHARGSSNGLSYRKHLSFVDWNGESPLVS